MSEQKQESKKKIPLNIPNNLCSPNLSLSILTLPVLIGMATIEHFHNNLIELGSLSEEIFRGDRLPLLSKEEQN